MDDVLPADQVEADNGKNQRRRLVKTSDCRSSSNIHLTVAEWNWKAETGARGATTQV